jgi:hypothetical protein
MPIDSHFNVLKASIAILIVYIIMRKTNSFHKLKQNQTIKMVKQEVVNWKSRSFDGFDSTNIETSV